MITVITLKYASHFGKSLRMADASELNVNIQCGYDSRIYHANRE